MMTLGVILAVVGLAIVVSQLDLKGDVKSKVDREGNPPNPTTAQIATANTTTPVPTFKFPTFVDASDIDPSERVEIVWANGALFNTYKWSDFTDNSTTPMIPALLGGVVPIRPHVFGPWLYLDTLIYGGESLPPIKIENNIATTELPRGWDKNHDDYAYEVVNSHGDPIFQLIYNSQFSITINGIFPYPGGWMVADDLGFRSGTPFESVHLKPIFKYPSKDNARVRVQ